MNSTQNTLLLGKMVRWQEEDGAVSIGSITKVEAPIYSVSLGMHVTFVTIAWGDGHEPTRHTVESLRSDSRVEIEP